MVRHLCLRSRRLQATFTGVPSGLVLKMTWNWNLGFAITRATVYLVAFLVASAAPRTRAGHGRNLLPAMTSLLSANRTTTRTEGSPVATNGPHATTDSRRRDANEVLPPCKWPNQLPTSSGPSADKLRPPDPDGR